MTTTASPAARSAVRRTGRAERLIIPAAFITNLGNSVQLTAASVLIFTTEGTMLALGWLFVAVAIPQMLFSLAFGHLADRFDRRTLCLVADLASALAAIALPIWLWLGGPANFGATTVSFGLAIVAALFMPASSALIKERIPQERLGRFNANYEIAVQAGTLLSAAVGGFMIQLYGVRPLFAFNALTFLASAAMMYALGRRPSRQAGPERGAEAGSGDEAGSGTEAGSGGGPEPREHVTAPAAPLIRLGLLYAVGNVVILVGNPITLALVIVQFGSTVGVLGVTEALFGIGVVGAATAYKWAQHRTALTSIALIGYVGFATVLALETVHLTVMISVMALAGVTFGLARISARTMLMSAAPDSRTGRVFGATNAVGLGLGTASLIAIAMLVDRTSPRLGFLALAALVLALSVPILLSLRTRPEEQVNPAQPEREATPEPSSLVAFEPTPLPEPRS